jgi:hypothetical protein
MLGLQAVTLNLAKAITAYLRATRPEEQTRPLLNSDLEQIQHNSTGAGPVISKSYRLEVYIHIRWAWMAFSGSVVVLTMLFFVMIVAQSAGHGVAVWKSSPLALLYHGVESEQA